MSIGVALERDSFSVGPALDCAPTAEEVLQLIDDTLELETLTSNRMFIGEQPSRLALSMPPYGGSFGQTGHIEVVRHGSDSVKGWLKTRFNDYTGGLPDNSRDYQINLSESGREQMVLFVELFFRGNPGTVPETFTLIHSGLSRARESAQAIASALAQIKGKKVTHVVTESSLRERDVAAPFRDQSSPVFPLRRSDPSLLQLIEAEDDIVITDETGEVHRTEGRASLEYRGKLGLVLSIAEVLKREFGEKVAASPDEVCETLLKKNIIIVGHGRITKEALRNFYPGIDFHGVTQLSKNGGCLSASWVDFLKFSLRSSRDLLTNSCYVQKLSSSGQDKDLIASTFYIARILENIIYSNENPGALSA